MKKRRITAMFMAVCMLAAAGCGKSGNSGFGKKEISDSYVTISQYKGVEAEKVEAEKAQDEDVTSYIDSVLAEHREEVTDRALKEGDLAEFEYTGKLGEEVFDEGTLTLGNGESYVDGFAEGIYGHKVGETFELPIKFPEGYGGEEKPELSGADVVFTIKITSIKSGELPELNDELVKKASEKSKTVEEYKKEVKEIIQKSNNDQANTALADNAWKKVMENVKVKEYPKDRLDKVKKQLEDQMKKMIQYYGMDYDSYLEQSGMTEKQFEENIEEGAKEYLKQVLAAELIADKENIKISDKEYKKLMKEYAKEYGYPDEKIMKEQIGETQVKEMILQDKVKELVADHCKQVEPKKEEKDEKNDEVSEETPEEEPTEEK